MFLLEFHLQTGNVCFVYACVLEDDGFDFFLGESVGTLTAALSVATTVVLSAEFTAEFRSVAMTVPTVPQVFPVVPLSAVGIGLLIGVIHYVGVCFTTYQFDCFVKGVNFVYVLHVAVDKGKLIHEFLRSYRVAVAVGACFSEVFALNTQTIQIGERGETVGVVCKEVTFHVAAFEILVGFASVNFLL